MRKIVFTICITMFLGLFGVNISAQQVDLNGDWYFINDGQNQRCYINQRGVEVALTNEKGKVVTGFFKDNKYITIVNGGSLTGTLVNSKQIDWNNSTSWYRNPVAGGAWFLRGNNEICSIIENGGLLTFINENGESSEGTRDDNSVYAKKWEIRGVFDFYKRNLRWDNGSYWFRVSNLEGSYRFGNTQQLCQIIQDGIQLTFINENGEKSGGYFKDDKNLTATDWGNLSGFINWNEKNISWGNNTNWYWK